MAPTNDKIGQFLKKQRKEAEERDAKRRAEKHGLSYLNLISTTAPTEIKAMELISKDEAKKARIVPVQLIGKKLVVAVYNPENTETKKAIKRLKSSHEVSVVVTTTTSLEHAWGYYNYIKEEGEAITGRINIKPEEVERIQKSVNSLADFSKNIGDRESGPTSEIIETIFGGALGLRASDVHLEPEKEGSTIRLRIDGLLHPSSRKISQKTHKSIVNRVKLLSGLKLNVKNEAQDGRFTVSLPDREIEIRTSVIPSEYGEGVVMRLLDPAKLKIDLTELGWREDDLEIVQKEIKKPNGFVLNTGPTGSGKTTTLYAFVRRLNKPEVKIITIEDPIEYHIEGISQTQTDADSGYTFAAGLRSIVRQDPDIILVGEIRDKETAEIALNASLTGHFVFSTLHTNDAIGSIPRLLDLGAKPNVLGPALTLVIAQRLVRLLCLNCKQELKADKIKPETIKKFLRNLPNRLDTKKYENFKLFQPEGCKECGNLGYKGRTSIFELFQITEEIESSIYGNPTDKELKELAGKQGMVTMQEDGILKALEGKTSLEEVERLTGPINW